MGMKSQYMKHVNCMDFKACKINLERCVSYLGSLARLHKIRDNRCYNYIRAINFIKHLFRAFRNFHLIIAATTTNTCGPLFAMRPFI